MTVDVADTARHGISVAPGTLAQVTSDENAVEWSSPELAEILDRER